MAWLTAVAGAQPVPSQVPLRPPGETPPSPSAYAPASSSCADAGPEQMDYDSDTVPPCYTHVRRRRKGLVLGGAVTLGLSYAMALAGAAATQQSQDPDDRKGGEWMAVPVVGPFIYVGENERGLAPGVILGLLETGGAAMLIAGLATHRDLFVRVDTLTVRVTPIVGATNGLAAVGTF